ncbi:translation initiation factor IF-2 [Candidatus Pacearchaeota archaeon]|nr:MAG: translation initiation factor IF-2 [Candidatus Pacearchaeota archaeon]
MEEKIRQPIVTLAGHVDHGKTSILDCFRGTCVQEKEAGGITQRIYFTKYPLDKVRQTCPLIDKAGIKLQIPGFLFIDTPGHAAFTNLRKRGGSLADLAILVVSIKEGIKPQTAEVIQILKANKTPFIVALNKIDTITGWQKLGASLKESIESQSQVARDEFQTLLLTFQGALDAHGFRSALYYEVQDFTREIAIVPCSARTREGIQELLFALCGLSQKFLLEQLKLSDVGKGIILEVKKEKNMEYAEAILHDGELAQGDEIVIASFEGSVQAKVRIIEEIEPLSFKYRAVQRARAATGLRLQLTNKEKILPGMPFQKNQGNIEEIEKEFSKLISESIVLDSEGIIAKADSLGSLEALLTLLRQENIKVVKAGIGDITKADIISAKANEEINPLYAVIVGFNVGLREEESVPKGVKVISHDVVYKIVEELKEWQQARKQELEREVLMSLAPVFKLEILHNFVFRNSNPAVFGVRVVAGKAVPNVELIDESGEKISKLKSIQSRNETIGEAAEGSEVAIALPNLNFERKLKDKRFLYPNLSAKEISRLLRNSNLLTQKEIQVLQELIKIKQIDEAEI